MQIKPFVDTIGNFLLLHLHLIVKTNLPIFLTQLNFFEELPNVNVFDNGYDIKRLNLLLEVFFVLCNKSKLEFYFKLTYKAI